jgi:hypothetical protein
MLDKERQYFVIKGNIFACENLNFINEDFGNSQFLTTDSSAIVSPPLLCRSTSDYSQLEQRQPLGEFKFDIMTEIPFNNCYSNVKF